MTIWEQMATKGTLIGGALRDMDTSLWTRIKEVKFEKRGESTYFSVVGDDYFCQGRTGPDQPALSVGTRQDHGGFVFSMPFLSFEVIPPGPEAEEVLS